ncbi:MAG: hypothetical protein ACT4QD_09645 [Acidobacteriota bacterium]
MTRPSENCGLSSAAFARILPLLLLCLAVPGVAASQAPPQADPFERVSILLGSWEGTSDGQPGKGIVRREYARALNGRFIRVRNRSEYPAQEKNPKGEIHDDEGFISFDRGRKKLVLRQFHVEGFVNQYVEDADSSPGRFVFTTESIENIPPGWRARETYVVHSQDEVEEVFELAESGKPFEVYSRTRLRRQK